MAIDLKRLKPHKVSKDLSGYITYMYGPPKVGKTTLGSQMPKPLLLAFEKGYNAIPGIIAQDITQWSEMKTVQRQLKDAGIKETFSTVIVDTVDIAANFCEKYVCMQNNVDTISQIPYGQGWGLLKKEFEEVFRSITQMGYAVYFISHAKEGSFKRPDGTEYTIVRPAVANSYNNILENMADIYGYMHPVYEDGNSTVKITLRSTDGTISCGGRFKYIVPEIDATYEALVKALGDAIDKEAELTNNKFVTEARENYEAETYDFDEYMAKAKTTIQSIIAAHSEDEFNENYAPRITQIIERYLGKGKKLSACTRDQVEMIVLIANDLADIK